MEQSDMEEKKEIEKNQLTTDKHTREKNEHSER
jgi:hypothetical protein